MLEKYTDDPETFFKHANIVDPFEAEIEMGTPEKRQKISCSTCCEDVPEDVSIELTVRNNHDNY